MTFSVKVALSRFSHRSMDSRRIFYRRLVAKVETYREFYTSAFRRDREIVSYRYVQPSTQVLCTHTYTRYAYTQAYEKKKKIIEQSRDYVKDAHRTLSLACVYSASFVFSLYTDIYNRLPYKDLHAALLMLTHRLNVSLENLSRDPPGPYRGSEVSDWKARLSIYIVFFLYVFSILI